MVYSIIQKFQLEGALRLDAEYYQPEYLAKKQALLNFPTVKLGEVAFVTDGEHGSPIFDETSGIKYFSAQHVRDCFINGLEAKNISKIIDNKNERSRLKVGDILLSTVGTIGFAGLITDDLLPANIDRHVARIALNGKTIEPEFLIAFLNSAYGKFQSIREATGNVQLNIFIDKIKEFQIPKNNNTEIAEMIRNGLKELKNSKKYYQQAENLLLEKLGLKGFNADESLFSIVNLFDIQSVHRMDAEYFQDKVGKILKIISKNSKLVRLENIADIKRGSLINPDFYNSEGTPYLRGGDFSSGRIESDSLVCVNKKFIPNNETMLNTGDIVFASIGNVGTLALVKDEFDGSFISNNTAKISINNKDEIIPDYLDMVLQSVIGKLQFKKESTQTAQPKISDSQVKSFYIPILSKQIQQKIAGLARQSHIARKKAKELLEEAKRKVEEMIENNSN